MDFIDLEIEIFIFNTLSCDTEIGTNTPMSALAKII